MQDQESGDTMQVRYHGVKPGNFEDAISIVAIGQYSADQEEFAANKLLVKCPSKYQGLDETKSYS
jgi:cytochrome c-type biogenesis protein CcmE